jgi:hypothetical protein
VTIKLSGFNEASVIDNNNFEVGLAGWDLEAAPGATLEQHVELAGPQPDIYLRQSLEGLPGDYDLVITTSGIEGEYVASHTFTSSEDTTLVRARYRFVTQEVPKGNFGSHFNDYFRVTLRSLKGGSEHTE